MNTYEQKFWLVVDADDPADAQQAIEEITGEIDEGLRGTVFTNDDASAERHWSLSPDGPIEAVERMDD